MEYKKIVDFSFNNIRYTMFIDNKSKKFFLEKKDNNEYTYLSYVGLVELYNHFRVLSNVCLYKKDNKKYSFIPKIVIGGVAVPLTLLSFLTINSLYESQKRLSLLDTKTYSNSSINSPDDYLSFVEDNNDVKLDTYLESSQLNYLFIYDNDYLDKAFDPHNVTYDELCLEIDNNVNIAPEMKELIKKYCFDVTNKYKNIDLRVFYENLKTLDVVLCSKEELVKNSLSVESYGCYVRSENKIYLLKDYKYVNGSWAWQVLYHELSHCLRTGLYNINGTKVKVQVEGQNYNSTIVAEALNSIFAVSLYDENEKDIAYQLQSNYFKVILDCIDNYDITDYCNHSLSYLPKQLDEFNNDDGYALSMLNLMEFQYDDYHSDKIKTEKETYYPLYSYIFNMYCKKYYVDGMNYDDIKSLTDNLVKNIMFDVPEEYDIDTLYFYDLMDEFCVKHSIIDYKINR